jgi:esterase
MLKLLLGGRAASTKIFYAFTSMAPARLNSVRLKSKKPTMKTLVVLHGLLGSSKQFKGICSNHKILNECDVHLIDMRNHQSSEFRETMLAKQLTHDILNYIHTNNLLNPILMGHSLGGRVSMHVALAAASLIKGLIVVDVAPTTQRRPGDDSQLIQLTGLQAKFMKQLQNVAALKLNGRQGEEAYKEIATAVGGEKSVADFMYANLQMNPEKIVTGWQINLKVILDHFPLLVSEEFKGEYYGPVRVIAGERSDYVSKESIPLFKKIFPNFSEEKDLVIIKDAGHWLHYDKPYIFIDELASFLKHLSI